MPSTNIFPLLWTSSYILACTWNFLGEISSIVHRIDAPALCTCIHLCTWGCHVTHITISVVLEVNLLLNNFILYPQSSLNWKRLGPVLESIQFVLEEIQWRAEYTAGLTGDYFPATVWYCWNEWMCSYTPLIQCIWNSKSCLQSEITKYTIYCMLECYFLHHHVSSKRLVLIWLPSTSL